MPDTNNRTAEIKRLIASLNKNRTFLNGKTITAGFDGFIDALVRIIKSKEEQASPVLFSRIGEFGDYILGKQGSSFSLETEEKSVRIGGNMPIMSHAIGQLGVHVNCIGAFGYPQQFPVFDTMSSYCQLYSFADPGVSTAFEFNDGKIMLAQMGQLNTLDWDGLKKRIGLDMMRSLYGSSNLFCMVNWSEIDMSTDIWKGLLQDIFPAFEGSTEKKICFFDLSDCSKRSPAAIAEALELIRQFSKYSQVILGLNRNEAKVIYGSIYGNPAPEDFIQTGKAIYEKIKPITLLLHSSKEAISFHEGGQYAAASFFTDDPAVSTGAGDNFNGGYCVAQLLELEPEASLLFANAVAGYYTRNGISPALPELISLLEHAATP